MPTDPRAEVEALKELSWFEDAHGEVVLLSDATDALETVLARPAPPSEGLRDEDVARLFHEAYERLAPRFGYRTRDASAKPWADVPQTNKALMTATVHEVRAALPPADPSAE